jgi:quercetin dioxygenase-like cupin family protein
MTVVLEHRDQSRTLQVIGDAITPLLSGKQFELFELSGPRDSGPPPHAHSWDEGYVIVEGELLIGSDAGETTARAGDRWLVPGGTTHWYRIVSDTARFLVGTGGQGAGRFFADMAAHVPGPPTEDTMGTVIEVAKRNGLSSPLF